QLVNDDLDRFGIRICFWHLVHHRLKVEFAVRLLDDDGWPFEGQLLDMNRIRTKLAVHDVHRACIELKNARGTKARWGRHLQVIHAELAAEDCQARTAQLRLEIE